MEQILGKDDTISRLLGEQKNSVDEPVRFLSYIIDCQLPDGALLYNCVTREVLLLTEDEFDLLKQLPSDNANECAPELIGALSKSWFLVPIEFNEQQFVDNARQVLSALVRKSTDAITRYTVLTTSNCNARCPYCYEHGCERMDMTEETANHVAAFIRENARDNDVRIQWFGGEPLLMPERITQICSTLRNAGVHYSGNIITNGLLFNEELIDLAKIIWNINHVQITLDGTESVYNETKRFVNVNDSPFRTVIGNIGKLLDAGINVTIRYNVTSRNIANLYDLTDYLHDLFGGYETFQIYAHETSQELKKCDGLREDFFDALSLLQDHLYKTNPHYSLSTPIRGITACSCMADNANSIAIGPDGTLSRCDHAVLTETYGSVSQSTLHSNEIEKWSRRVPPAPLCDTCPLYPCCKRLEKCAYTVQECTTAKQANLLLGRKHALLNVYRKWNGKQQPDCSNTLEKTASSGNSKSMSRKTFRIAGIEFCTASPDQPLSVNFSDFSSKQAAFAHQIAITEEDIELERNTFLQHCDPAFIDFWSSEERLPEFKYHAFNRKILEHLLKYDTVLLHGSCLCIHDKAYAFIAEGGVGKSTHRRMWQEVFGDDVEVINDDKPLVRIRKDDVIVCGSPWRGKEQLGNASSAPLAGICILERGVENHIERIEAQEALTELIHQAFRPQKAEDTAKTLEIVERISDKVPLYRMRCLPNHDAARMAYNAMVREDGC